MSVTSKSPRDVLVTAREVAKQAIRPYSHRCSPKKFPQHQLFATLVLKNFLRVDYRGVVETLRDCPDLAKAIELPKVPHFPTLQKASQRLLGEAIRHVRITRIVADAGYDSEGNRRFSRQECGARWPIRRVNRMACLTSLLYADQWKTYWDDAT